MFDAVFYMFMLIRASKKTENFNYAIRNVVAAADRLRNQGRDVISLNIGDPQEFGFRPPIELIDAVDHANRNGFTGYAPSAGLSDARDAVAEYATKLGSPTDSSDVYITAGASEAADLVLTALLDEGDEVILPNPGYPLYEAILNRLGAHAVHYKLDPDKNWQPDAAEIETLITDRTRAILLINPNNPTGAITSDATTVEILKLAAERDTLIISDEVYRELCFDKPPTAASLLARDMPVALVTLESLSKTHTLPGWRVGWMRFTNSDRMPDLIAAVGKLAGGRLCSPTPPQYAVRPALHGSRKFIDGFIADVKLRRDKCIERISQIDGVSCTVPGSAFYLMVRVETLVGETDEDFALRLLNEHGVLVVHGSGFGMRPDEGYFRLVYLADPETLDLAFDAIEKAVRSSGQPLESNELFEAAAAVKHS